MQQFCVDPRADQCEKEMIMPEAFSSEKRQLGMQERL